MVENNYIDLISLLDCNLPPKIQEEAINKILKLSDFNPQILLQPMGKEHWENAAKILKDMDYKKIIHLSPYLFEWIQDLNWPGAYIIIEMLSSFPKEQLVPYLEDAVRIALKTNDEQWIDYLSYFTFCNTVSKEDFLNKNLFDLLKRHEDNQWIRET